MDLQQLEYLMAVYKEGTVSRAAEAMHVSQPAVTRSLKRLEEEFGMTFFDRTKNRISLKEEGLAAVEYAGRVLREAERMRTGLADYKERMQVITIGSCAPAPLWGLYALTPGKKHRYLLTEDAEVLVEGFRNREYHLLVLDFPMTGKDITTLPYLEEQLYLAVNRGDPFASRESMTFAEINGRDLLVLDGVGYWKEICNELLPDSTILYQDPETYQILQRVTTLPQFRTSITLQRYRSREDKIYIPISDPQATLHFYLHYHTTEHQFDCLQQGFASLPWDTLDDEILKT